MEKHVVNIENSDRAVGWMARQIFESANEERWYVAMASLFMLIEQVLRWATDVDDSQSLKNVIDNAFKQQLISGEDRQILHEMRQYRNKYMHSNFHANVFEIDGLLYSVNEVETAGKVFEILKEPTLKMVVKLLNSDPELQGS